MYAVVILAVVFGEPIPRNNPNSPGYIPPEVQAVEAWQRATRLDRMLERNDRIDAQRQRAAQSQPATNFPPGHFSGNLVPPPRTWALSSIVPAVLTALVALVVAQALALRWAFEAGQRSMVSKSGSGTATPD